MKRPWFSATILALALALLAASRCGGRASEGAAGAAPPRSVSRDASEATVDGPAEIAGGASRSAAPRPDSDPSGPALRGTVVDRLDRPIAGAAVLLMQRAGGTEPAARATTSATGEFELPLAGNGGELLVDAAGHVDLRLPLRGPWTEPPLRLVLDAARSIRGFVTMEGAIEGTVELRVLESAPPHETRAWRIAGPGSFEIDDAPAGQLECLATAAGFTPVLVRAPEDPANIVSIDLRRGAAATLEVRVRGEPFESIRVDVGGGARIGVPQRTLGLVTGPRDGPVVFEGLPDGLLEVTATSQRTRGWTRRAVTQAGAGTRTLVELDFTLPEARIARLIADGTSAPLAGIAIEFHDPRGGIDATCITGADGTVRLPPGGSIVALDATCRTPGWTLIDGARWGTITFAPGTADAPLVLRARPARSLRGLVTLNGAPADTSVRVQIFRGVPRPGDPLSAEVTGDGRFRFEIPEDAAGRHTIVAEAHDAEGMLELDLARVPGDLPAIELAAFGSLFGAARNDGGTVAALGDVRIRRVDSVTGSPTGWGERVVTLDASGAFRCERLAPGSYRLSATRARTAPCLVALAPGEHVGPVELRAESASSGRISGTVVLADGSPAARAQVSAVAISAGPTIGEFRATRADIAGRFELEVNAPGLHELSAMLLPALGGVASRSLEPVLAPAGAADARIVVAEPATATLAGRLFAPANVDATLCASNGVDSALRHLRAGAFEIASVPAGRCMLRFSASGRASVHREVELGAGERVDVGDIRLVDLRPVRVLVLDEHLAPCSDVEVFALPDSVPLRVPPPSEHSLGRTDANGAIEAPALGELPVQIVAWSPGYAPATAEVRPDDASPEAKLVVRRGVTLRIDGLEHALAEFLFWTATLRKSTAPEVVVRAQGVNRLVPWIEIRDLEPGEYRLEVHPTVARSAESWIADIALRTGGDLALLLHVDGRRAAPPEGPR